MSVCVCLFAIAFSISLYFYKTIVKIVFTARLVAVGYLAKSIINIKLSQVIERKAIIFCYIN
jgi:hypothetical protein